MTDQSLQIACFDVAGACYALPVSTLREIVKLPSISSLPDAPPLVEGLIDLRGSLVPVVDLARIVGARSSLGEREGDEKSAIRVAVVAAPELLLGLCVDAAREVVTVAVGDCEPVPAVAQGGPASVVHSVVRRPGHSPIMILSIEGLIERISASAVRGEAA